MNVLLLCRKFKKDKSMKKGRFSLLGIVALFLGLILVSCSDDDDQGGVKLVKITFLYLGNVNMNK